MKTAATVDALLLPWGRTGISPPKVLENQIKDFLIAALGDPRFKRSAPRWRTISEEARSVLKHWLNRAAIMQFFDIVEEAMTDPAELRMWKYRRVFWTTYLNEVSDAWVVLGKKAIRIARDTAFRTKDSSFKQFGVFRTAGAVASHAVLILTIGNLRIAEWSHSGKCRMWENLDHAPKPYEKDYAVYDLRHGEWEASHTSANTYGWQRVFAAQIRTYTGIRKHTSEFMI